MLDKIGHIKNPLTVIAMFAGIAEVSGAVVLPLLEKDVQETYVLFLMGFPCLLVILFFVTLWAKHTALYAPSDFSDDKNFVDLFRKGGFVDYGIPDVSADVEVVLDEPAEAPAELVVVPYEPPAQAELTPQYVMSTLKHRALKRMSTEFGAPFLMDAVPVDQPDMKFDFIMELPDAQCVGSVFYTFNNFETIDEVNIERALRDAYVFWKRLKQDTASKFIFFAIVILEHQSHAQRVTVISKISRIAGQYRFKTVVKAWEMSSLEGYADS